MHKIFLIPELVDHILHHLYSSDLLDQTLETSVNHVAERERGEGYQEVQALSLTSPLFREATLNAMWRTQYSLIPILRSVNVLEGPKDSNYGPAYRFRRALQDEDIPVITKYSSRIKYLHFTPHVVLEVSTELDTIPSSVVLFRSLGCLIAPFLGSPEFVLRTTGDALRVVNIPFTIPTMAALAPRGTNLTSLTLLPCGMTAEQASVICAVIQKAVHLRKLRIAMDASGVLWDAASQLPSLQWLSVDFENLHTFMLGARSTRRVFSDLTFLDIRTPEIAYATMLLHDSLHPQLRHLQYLSQAERQASHALATSLFEAIADSCSPAVLTDLDFFIENLEELSEEHLIFDPIRSSALRPLLRFTRLTTFSLDLFWSWDLDNSLIQEMAHAWPQLKVLRLDPNFYGPPAESRITLRGLEPLAMHCPHLQVFGATIDATTLPADGPLPIINTGQAPQSPLTSLLVGDSKIQSFLRVARYLSRLFPALQRIQTYDLLNVWEGMEEEVEFAGELWREVVTLVQVMALVREQERRTPSVSDIANA